MVVDFIDTFKARFGVVPICRVLCEHGVGIAPSSYYAHRRRPEAARTTRERALAGDISELYHDPRRGRGLYGARKVWLALRREGRTVARCTVERLMRQQGLVGVTRGAARRRTTRADATAKRPADLVDRQFTASRPNRLWVVDFTYVSTWQQTAYTAFVIDVFSRRIVGWRCATSMPTELPLDALEMALDVRARQGQTVAGLIHHSDAGGQYTAIRYSERLRDAGAVASIGSVGDSYDNALAESTIGLYKTECTDHEGPWRSVEELELATLLWIDWYNNDRLHSSIGDIPPVEYEHNHSTTPAAAATGKTT